jgi:DNA-directed RNA polymerase
MNKNKINELIISIINKYSKIGYLIDLCEKDPNEDNVKKIIHAFNKINKEDKDLETHISYYLQSIINNDIDIVPSEKDEHGYRIL